MTHFGMRPKAVTLAGALTIAGAFILLAGFAPMRSHTADRSVANPALQVSENSATRMLTLPAAENQVPQYQYRRVMDRDDSCMESLHNRSKNRADDGAPPTNPLDAHSFTRQKQCPHFHG